jgi:hypothetical protein
VGTTTVEAAVYDSGTGLFSTPTSATFTVSAPAPTTGLTFNPVSDSAITTSTPITITSSPGLSTDEAVYWNTTGDTLSTSDNHSNPFELTVSGTVYAAVYDSTTGAWGTPTSATFTVSAPLTAIVAITGTPQVGSVLTAGALTPSGATASYQWQESATPGGTYTAITGATTGTYTPVAGDATKYIEVVATGTGSYSGTETSAATGPVAAAPVINPGPGSSGGGGSVSYNPAVQTEAATTVTATSVALNGDITSDSGYAITDYGFLWGINSSSLTNKLDVGTDNHSGAFTDTLSSLSAGTTYYFEAYATNSYGTADGAPLSFTAGVQPSTTPTTPTTPATPASVFSDVSARYWGYNAITNLSNEGIVSGYPDGTFKPNAAITRSEFAAMLVKALGLNTTGTTGRFTDVTADAWYYGPVNAAAAAGLVSGMGDNLFSPEALITREQMAVMVAKALGNQAPATDGTELNAFNDRSHVSSWVMSGMDEAVKAGIVVGMSADHLAPQAHATRAQAAAMLYKMLIFLGK